MISKPQVIDVLEVVAMGLRKMDWLTLKQTPWEPNKIAADGVEITLLQKRYYVKRRDGLPINVFITSLPGDHLIIRDDLEICAARALRSFVGCACTMTGMCKAHRKPLDVCKFRGAPDAAANSPEGLRKWLEEHNG